MRWEDRWERSVNTPLRSASLDEIAGQLRIEGVIMPTDPSGVSDPRQQPDAISSPRSLLGGLGRWLRCKSSLNGPVRSDRISNSAHPQWRTGDYSRDCGINEPRYNGRRAGAFLISPGRGQRWHESQPCLCQFDGREHYPPVPLPIYFNPLSELYRDFTGAGRYERAIEVKIWGSDATVLRATQPLLIVTPNFHAMLVTSIVLVVTGLGVGLLLLFNQQLFSYFSTKQLILIALFGTTIFIAVNVPSTLLTNLISALLGPVLISGHRPHQ